MYLKRLELSGFKSFAKPGVFEFKSPITAVVGPNGSGKSNIAEAIRFVLGEQSMKSLRSKRGEDLIFNGSKTLSRLNRASVAITFDNAKRTIPLDYDEIELKRVMHRDSLSEYYINGSLVRLKDVLELLANLHIGASNHHIISQGGTDRILNASPEERRSMIEDALGLKVYEYKRAESERKLKKTRENIAQVESLRKELAPHIAFLEKQVAKVRQAENLREELRKLYAEYLFREEHYVAVQKTSFREGAEGSGKELKELERKIEHYEKELIKSGTGDAQEIEELRETKRSLEEVRNNKDTLARELGRLEGIIEVEETALADELEAIKQEVSVTISRSKLDSLRTTLEEKTSAVLLSTSIDELMGAITSIRSIAKNFFEGIGEIESPEIRQRRKAREEGLTSKKIERSKLADTFSGNQREEKRLTDLYSQISETLEKDKNTERRAERELFMLKGRRSELLSRLELLKVREEKLHTDEQNYSIERDEAYALLGKYIVETDVKSLTNIDFLEDRGEQEKRRRAVERIKIKLEDVGGGGEEIMKEYKDTTERDSYLAKEVEDLTKSAFSLESLINELKDKIDSEFSMGIEKINKEFERYFDIMFTGGHATLKIIRLETKPKKDELLDENLGEEPHENEENSVLASEGVEITVSHPNKRIKGLQALSGGERTLTSIALIFALTQVNPPPFLVLDEADAALDETNSLKYGELLERLSRTTQFMIITHNRETMTKAGVLYGVTITGDGATRLLSIKLGEAIEIAKE